MIQRNIQLLASRVAALIIIRSGDSRMPSCPWFGLGQPVFCRGKKWNLAYLVSGLARPALHPSPAHVEDVILNLFFTPQSLVLERRGSRV